MISSSPAIPTGGLFKRARAWEAVTLLALAWLVPFAVHLVPWSGERPIGVHLAPVFWTGFVAVYLFGLRLGLVVALFAPAVNLVVTGLPALERLSWMSFELTVFTVGAWAAVKRRPKSWVIAPLAWLVARTAYTLLQIMLGSKVHADAGYFAESIGRALPGLAVLLVVNFTLCRLYPKPAPDEITVE